MQSMTIAEQATSPFQRHHRIGFAIDESGMSREDLAKVLGVSPGTITNYRRKRSNPTLGHVRLIAEATGFELRWLQDGVGPWKSDGGPDLPRSATAWTRSRSGSSTVIRPLRPDLVAA